MQISNAASRFRLTSLEVGKGAHGRVSIALDVERNQTVAVKTIAGVSDGIGTARRVLRELRLLRLLRHENILNATAAWSSVDEVMIATELMDSDLDNFIGSSEAYSHQDVRQIMLQLLRGVQYLHENGVLHRDLKPRNILVDKNLRLKICDFGLARALTSQTAASVCPMTDYVATRWYRAPEILIGSRRYSFAMDMWSVGCIFAELLLKTAIFPGMNSTDQLHRILQIIGTPSAYEIGCISNSNARYFIENLPERPNSLSGLLGHCESAELSLLSMMLTFDPDSRITAAEALMHPYFAGLHCLPSPTTKRAFNPDADFAFETWRLTHAQLSQMIAEETFKITESSKSLPTLFSSSASPLRDVPSTPSQCRFFLAHSHETVACTCHECPSSTAPRPKRIRQTQPSPSVYIADESFSSHRSSSTPERFTDGAELAADWAPRPKRKRAMFNAKLAHALPDAASSHVGAANILCSPENASSQDLSCGRVASCSYQLQLVEPIVLLPFYACCLVLPPGIGQSADCALDSCKFVSVVDDCWRVVSPLLIPVAVCCDTLSNSSRLHHDDVARPVTQRFGFKPVPRRFRPLEMSGIPV